MTKIFRVGGMECEGCAKSVERAVRAAVPDAEVTVDLAGGLVTVDEAAEQVVAAAITEAGFEFLGLE